MVSFKKLPDKLRTSLLLSATILFGIVFLLTGHRVAARNSRLFKGDDGVQAVSAKVLEITRETVVNESMFGLETRETHFEARVTSGEYKGLLIEGKQMEDPFTPVPMRDVQKGDRILLYPMSKNEDGSTNWVLQEYQRSNALLALGIFFVFLLILFGRKKGILTVISLTFTCLGIFLVFIPGILSGYNIYACAGVVCGFIVLTTLTLVNGYNRKSLSAGVGCMGGLAVSGLLLLVMNRFLNLTGLIDEESSFLLYINPDNPIDLKAIVFCSIILGALGATLDVSVSIAASLSEIAETLPEPPGFQETLRSGINIGRDIMGTMANTLILAYIGGSMSLALLLISYSNSLLELFNRELIVVEILQSLVGSIGLLVTIPITAVFWAAINRQAQRKNGVRP